MWRTTENEYSIIIGYARPSKIVQTWRTIGSRRWNNNSPKLSWSPRRPIKNTRRWVTPRRILNAIIFEMSSSWWTKKIMIPVRKIAPYISYFIFISIFEIKIDFSSRELYFHRSIAAKCYFSISTDQRLQGAEQHFWNFIEILNFHLIFVFFIFLFDAFLLWTWN